MALLSTAFPTLPDWAAAISPDGRIAAIVNTITPTNPILDHAIFLEGNLPTGHETTILTGYPLGTWRRLYGGVPSEKSSRQKVTDTIGMLESRFDIDAAQANLNGLKEEFMAMESMSTIKGLGRTLAETLFYGDSNVNPERFTGLAPRYSTLSTDDTQSGFNVIDAGGIGIDNTSIWMVTWDPTSTHMIFPKGQAANTGKGFAGIEHWKENNGEEMSINDAAGNPFRGYREWYKFQSGLCVRDWRQNVRIANIDVSNLAGAGSGGYSGAELVNFLTVAYRKLEEPGTGRTYIYCNRSAATALDLIVNNKVTNAFSNIEQNGQPLTAFNRIPIIVCDSILNSEARVV